MKHFQHFPAHLKLPAPMKLRDTSGLCFSLAHNTASLLSPYPDRVRITATSGTNEHLEQINKMSNLIQSLPLG